MYTIFSLFSCFQSRFYPYRSFKQQLMTSKIRSHTDYWTQTYNIFGAHFASKLIKNPASLAFNTIQ